jgi:hypothetical protein
MLASSGLVVYKDQVPYVKQVQGALQFVMVGYVFTLLVQWQEQQSDVATS